MGDEVDAGLDGTWALCLLNSLLNLLYLLHGSPKVLSR